MCVCVRASQQLCTPGHQLMCSSHTRQNDLREALEDLRDKGEHFSEERLLKYAAQLCAALRFCHGKRIVHRGMLPNVASCRQSSTSDLCVQTSSHRMCSWMPMTMCGWVILASVDVLRLPLPPTPMPAPTAVSLFAVTACAATAHSHTLSWAARPRRQGSRGPPGWPPRWPQV